MFTASVSAEFISFNGEDGKPTTIGEYSFVYNSNAYIKTSNFGDRVVGTHLLVQAGSSTTITRTDGGEFDLISLDYVS